MSSHIIVPIAIRSLIYISSSSHIFNPPYYIFAHLGGVVVLDPPLAISVHEASAAPVALGRATTADARRAVTTERAAEAEQHGCDQEAGERGPGKGQQVAANGGFEAGGAEGVAALDDPGTRMC